MGERPPKLKLLKSSADLPQNTYGTDRPKQYPCLAICVDLYEKELFVGSRLLTKWKYIYLDDVIPLLEEVGRRGTEPEDGSNGSKGDS